MTVHGPVCRLCLACGLPHRNLPCSRLLSGGQCSHLLVPRALGRACPLKRPALPSESQGLWAEPSAQSAFQCGNMAREGLRVLVVAKKSLAEEQYQDFEVSGSVTFLSVSQPCPPPQPHPHPAPHCSLCCSHIDVIPEHTRLTSVTGPLHLLFSLLGALFPHRASSVLLSHSSSAAASEKSSWTPRLRQPHLVTL